MRGIHTRPNRGATVEWLTPPYIIHALGPFDLDPCAPINRPWDTATRHFTLDHDGLRQPWFGRVWLNPPYGTGQERWLERLVKHGNGIALIAARTETEAFWRYVWLAADAVLFLHGRLFFHHPNGERAKSNAGHGSVLVAYGVENADRLRGSRIPGVTIPLALQTAVHYPLEVV